MADNLYLEPQPVYMSDPSGRLAATGLTRVQFPYTPTVSVITQTVIVRMIWHILIFNNVHLKWHQTLNLTWRLRLLFVVRKKQEQC